MFLSIRGKITQKTELRDMMERKLPEDRNRTGAREHEIHEWEIVTEAVLPY